MSKVAVYLDKIQLAYRCENSFKNNLNFRIEHHDVGFRSFMCCQRGQTNTPLWAELNS